MLTTVPPPVIWWSFEVQSWPKIWITIFSPLTKWGQVPNKIFLLFALDSFRIMVCVIAFRWCIFLEILHFSAINTILIKSRHWAPFSCTYICSVPINCLDCGSLIHFYFADFHRKCVTVFQIRCYFCYFIYFFCLQTIHIKYWGSVSWLITVICSVSLNLFPIMHIQIVGNCAVSVYIFYCKTSNYTYENPPNVV